MTQPANKDLSMTSRNSPSSGNDAFDKKKLTLEEKIAEKMQFSIKEFESSTQGNQPEGLKLQNNHEVTVVAAKKDTLALSIKEVGKPLFQFSDSESDDEVI